MLHAISRCARQHTSPHSYSPEGYGNRAIIRCGSDSIVLFVVPKNTYSSVWCIKGMYSMPSCLGMENDLRTYTQCNPIIYGLYAWTFKGRISHQHHTDNSARSERLPPECGAVFRSISSQCWFICRPREGRWPRPYSWAPCSPGLRSLKKTPDVLVGSGQNTHFTWHLCHN